MIESEHSNIANGDIITENQTNHHTVPTTANNEQEETAIEVCLCIQFHKRNPNNIL